MNNQKGFTLIELIVVIVILGILSAVAVPKFVDMQDDAKKAALEGARGAVKSASALVHGKWLVAGEVLVDGSAGSGFVAIGGGVYVAVTNGYPDATTTGIMAATDISDDFELNGEVITRDGDYSIVDDDKYWGFTYKTSTAPGLAPQVSIITETTVI